jgi:dihydrofolate reductase
MSDLVIIAALAKNYVIGKEERIPWNIPEDIHHFKTKTTNHAIIVGRKTYEHLPIRPLPDRTNVVLTRQNIEIPGAIVKHSLDEAIKYCKENSSDDIFIIGGSKVYEEALPLANKLELTWIDREYEGDTYFPKIDFSKWELISEHKRDGFSFCSYVRK